MKTFLLAFLCLSLPLSAKPNRVALAHRVVAEIPEPLPESVPMARQRSAQEDAELRDWIVGIQTTAQDAERRADAAETEAKSSRDQTAIAGVRLEQAAGQLTDLQAKYNGVEDERDKAIGERDAEHKARVAAEAHVSKIKTWLGLTLGALLALAVEYLLAQFTLPPLLAGYFIWIRVGAPILAFALGWTIVARCV